MTYVLDTNVFSALLRGEGWATERLAGIPRTEVAIPQPVIAEIEFGLHRLRRSRRKAFLERRAGLFLAALHRAEWTDRVSQCFGHIKAQLQRQGMGIEDFDVAIAAHALATNATLVTRNTSHMVRVAGLVV